MKKCTALLWILLGLSIRSYGQVELPKKQVSNQFSLIDWDKSNRVRRDPYFGKSDFVHMYYRMIGDTNIKSGWVYYGPLTPRTIDSTTLHRLAEDNSPNVLNEFYCSPMWNYHWIQVRFMADRWQDLDKNSALRGWGGSQVGGFMIGCTQEGLFIAQETQLAYIPYYLIRNVRRGQSLGNWLNSASSSSSSIISGSSGDGGAFIIALPFMIAIHSLAGLSPQKVHRFYGDSTGMDFPAWVQGANAWGESRNALADFPKALLQSGRKLQGVTKRSDLQSSELDHAERVADMVWKHEIPCQFEVIQTDAKANDVVVRKNVVTAVFDKTPQFSDNKSVGIPTLELDGPNADTLVVSSNTNTVVEPKPLNLKDSLPPVKAAPPAVSNSPMVKQSLFDKKRNMPVQWAYQGFDANQVDPKLMKRFPNLRNAVLSDAQLNTLTKQSEIQFLSMYLITSNGLLLNGLVSFTAEQKLILQKVTPIFAEDATTVSVLNADDMSESDAANLEMLYQRLNK